MSISEKKCPVTSEQFEMYVAIDTVEAMWDDPSSARPIQGQWSMDSAESLTEAATQLREQAEYLENLAADGWELDEPIVDDWGWAIKTAKVDEIEAQVRSNLSALYEVVDDDDSIDPDLRADSRATMRTTIRGALGQSPVEVTAALSGGMG